MDDKNIHWDYYRTALAVLEEGSLSGAARSLGLTQPTVGRHIEALEQALGTSLFVRNQSGLSPTIAALAMKPYAESLRSTESALLRSVSAEANEVRGTVRVTASEVMGVEILPGILAGLRQGYPELSIELQISNHTQDLLKRDADIAIRNTEPLQDALIARRAGMISLGFFAHADYLTRHGMPADMDALKDHSLIGFDREFPYIRALQKRYPQIQRAAFALRADSDLVQFSAIRQGYGIGICQLGLARQQTHLQRVLADEFQIDFPVWVVMHEDLRSSQRYRTTFDHLVKELQAMLQKV
ncbi:LysR family transcriptional regulator [Undibacterium sp. Tian12W]|uniref:LysR family transcriptional regulator n=1 Tax=Undibacterium sp. Tian12W TaxID=3413054 RepID=UPI003BF053D8